MDLSKQELQIVDEIIELLKTKENLRIKDAQQILKYCADELPGYVLLKNSNFLQFGV